MLFNGRCYATKWALEWANSLNASCMIVHEFRFILNQSITETPNCTTYIKCIIDLFTKPATHHDDICNN